MMCMCALRGTAGCRAPHEPEALPVQTEGIRHPLVHKCHPLRVQLLLEGLDLHVPAPMDVETIVTTAAAAATAPTAAIATAIATAAAAAAAAAATTTPAVCLCHLFLQPWYPFGHNAVVRSRAVLLVIPRKHAPRTLGVDHPHYRRVEMQHFCLHACNARVDIRFHAFQYIVHPEKVHFRGPEDEFILLVIIDVDACLLLQIEHTAPLAPLPPLRL
jgi:hypothetical protein